jgi:hypothetical protein
MRYGVMSILALGLLMGAPAEAARNDQTAARNQPRPAASTGHAVTRPAAATTAGRVQVAAARQPAVPYHRASLSSAQQRSAPSRVAAACTVSNGRRVCGGGTRQVAMRWTGGLMPAAGNQTSCPDGTMATLAVGHENVVRCVPL